MDSCLKAWSHSLETGEPYSVEYRCRRFDGEWRWFLGRALPFRDPDGTIKGWSGTCTDFEDLYRVSLRQLFGRQQAG
jgi:PAS domain-containing protein